MNLNENTDIYQGLQHGGVAVVRCRLEHEEHYVLLTEIADSGIALFDPYEEIEGYFDGQSPSSIGVIVVKDEPKRYNRIVTRRILESTEPIDYALGPMEHREAILIFNESRR